MNRETYIKLIEEDIDTLNKYMPKESLERKHIIDVLNHSIEKFYPAKPKCPNCGSLYYDKGILEKLYICEICGHNEKVNK